METTGFTCYRGALYQPLEVFDLHAPTGSAYEWLPDAGLVVNEAGIVVALSAWEQIQTAFPTVKVIHFAENCLILPGLVDAHTHLPQWPVTAHAANTLLAWLEAFIFPEEARYTNTDYAREQSSTFFKALLAHGTTTAGVLLAPFAQATHIAFEEAQRQGNRVVMGLNLMDCGAPDELLSPANTLLAQTEQLCKQWHGAAHGRLSYAWAPRFAGSCSEALLGGVGRLCQEYPLVRMHTHLAEQRSEWAAIQPQFAWAKDYLAVYERFGLVRDQSLFAHGIHLSPSEQSRLKQANASLIHCPSANFFLKSGRFPWQATQQANLSLGLGSDVGAGPLLSMFQVMRDAQWMQLEDLICPHQLFYHATLGGAQALGLSSITGNLQPGKAADFIVVAPHAQQALIPENWQHAPLEIVLSRLIYQADPTWIKQTYVQGVCMYENPVV
ncbi:MAG: guanine deaminase [Candidatus Melainabacteria bacterium]|nr:guanine deaminase [Candidatus Melainabacteria bacterium]